MERDERVGESLVWLFTRGVSPNILTHSHTRVHWHSRSHSLCLSYMWTRAFPWCSPSSLLHPFSSVIERARSACVIITCPCLLRVITSSLYAHWPEPLQPFCTSLQAWWALAYWSESWRAQKWKEKSCFSFFPPLSLFNTTHLPTVHIR